MTFVHFPSQGFAVCFVLGVCISILGCIMFALNPLNLSTFAILYTLGNVVAIASTLFLMGPMKQVTTKSNITGKYFYYESEGPIQRSCKCVE